MIRTRSRSACRTCGGAAPNLFRSIRCGPAIRRSPTSGSGSALEPTGCWRWRWCMNCSPPTGSISTIWRATPTPRGWSSRRRAADDGLFARDAAGAPLALGADGQPVSAVLADTAVKLVGETRLDDGRRAVPVFQLVAARYLDPAYAPEAVAESCGVPAATIRRLAAELAQAAFAETIELPVAWTDWAGRRHDTMRGRPVAMHAMRGIAAHSNGFQTCRALHLLQMLLGTIDVPGGWRYKSPHPKPAPPGPKPAGKPEQVAPGTPLPGIPLGYPMGPEDLLIEADGGPARIDKAFSWEAPIAAHGLMHLVIRNAANGDPYPIDTLFMYMANMAWNSAMNTEIG